MKARSPAVAQDGIAARSDEINSQLALHVLKPQWQLAVRIAASEAMPCLWSNLASPITVKSNTCRVQLR